jgi:Predicted Zn-dependent proteases and their inactivated homologs
VRAVKGGYSGELADAPARTNARLYTDDNPLAAPGFDAKVKLLQDIDAYARGKDERVRQVSASVAASWQIVEIVRPDGEIYRDIRPLVRVNVSVVVGQGESPGIREATAFGGRRGLCAFHRGRCVARRRR